MRNKHRKKKHYNLTVFFCIITASFVLLNVSLYILFGQYTADFTTNEKYTLSKGSKEIVRSLDKPLYVKIYKSSSLDKNFPSYGRYAQFVLRFFDKYKRAAKGKINILPIKDPEPYSIAEKEAQDAGIRQFLSADGKENLYFGAVIYTENGDAYTISNFLEGRKEYLENDISRVLYEFVQTERKTVMVVGSREVMGLSFIKQIEVNYDVMPLSADVFEIPAFADALLIVNPKNVSPMFVYAVEQYVLRGGKVLVFVDAYNRKIANIESLAPKGNPSFDDLLKEWGVAYDYKHVLGDENLAKTSVFVEKGEKSLSKALSWLEVNEEYINKFLLMKGIKKLDLAYASWFDILNSKNVVSLFNTSDLSSLINASFIQQHPDANLSGFYDKKNEKFSMAVAIKGRFVSVFDKGIMDGTKYETSAKMFLATSVEDGEIIAVGDSDLLADDSWVASFFEPGCSIYGIVPKNSNAHFVLKMLDNLIGNDFLSAINNRNVLGGEKPIREKIVEKVYAKYAEDYYNLQQALVIARNELSDLTEGYNNTKRPPISVAKSIDQKQKEINILLDGVKQIDYMVKKEVDAEISVMINIISFIFPLLFVLIMLGLAKLVAVKNKRKALELLK